MAEHSMAYIAFDTSKLHNAVAIAEAGRTGEVRSSGRGLLRRFASRNDRVGWVFHSR